MVDAVMDEHIIGTQIPGVRVFQLKAFADNRGYFKELFSSTEMHADIGVEFVQDNCALSSKGVLRGMHYQDPYPQGKLVTALSGAIFDAIVDLRRDSPTFGKWCAIRLSDENGLQLYVPEGCAHGYLALSELALVQYKVTAPYHPEGSHYLKWDDPTVGIEWPLESEPILSEKDRDAPGWGE